MAIIRPRLNDYHNLPFTQEEVDFAIPFLDEDLPLFLDPFLLWKSPSLQDNSLHTAITNSINKLGHQFLKGDSTAVTNLILASECNEVGLGNSRIKKGRPIGRDHAIQILSLFKNIPQVNKCGFIHFEEIQLLTEHFASDRVSDIASSFSKSFLIDYTIQQCEKYKIPLEKCSQKVYDYRLGSFVDEETYLPVNPETKLPIVLLPKRWLRLLPWINYDDYFANYFREQATQKGVLSTDRVTVLDFNRHNYDVVQLYIEIKEKNASFCFNDPIFQPIPVISAKRKITRLKKLNTGKENNADKEYEDLASQLLTSFLYPKLDFATEQSRTESGALIRDLIFFNNRSYNFLSDIYDIYSSRQIVMELKNVKEINGEHINQLNRYLKDEFGKFGIIVTRNRIPKSIFRNTIDLWSGQRRCIIVIDDHDMETMYELYETKQRHPIDVIKKKYIEFSRACPS